MLLVVIYKLATLGVEIELPGNAASRSFLGSNNMGIQEPYVDTVK